MSDTPYRELVPEEHRVPLTEKERADLVVARMLERHPKMHQVVADARLFDSLKESPAWRRLYDKVEAKRDKWMGEMSRRFMGPQKFWPKPEEIAFNQGFYQGAAFVLGHPEHAEENLERAARVAWILSLEDDQEVDENGERH